MKKNNGIAFMVMSAVLLSSALTATAAMASTEGPFYKVGGSRLLSGESKELKSTLKSGEFIMYSTGGFAFTFECRSEKVAAGADILGSTGANGATGKATIEFGRCIAEGDGVPCEPVGSKITTEPLNTELVYASKERTGKLLEVFSPAAAKGKVFAHVTLEGAGCNVLSDPVEGDLVGQVRQGGAAVEFGKEPAESAKDEVEFSGSPVGTVWSERSGVVSELKPTVLKSFGRSYSSISGTMEQSLLGEPKWGVFTH